MQIMTMIGENDLCRGYITDYIC